MEYLKVNQENLSNSICALREKYLSDEPTFLKSFSDINGSFCYSFAEETIDKLDYNEDLYQMSDEDFRIYINEELDIVEKEGEICGLWNIPLLEEWDINPPNDLSWDEMNKIYFGYHVFIVLDKKFYDAECPEGTKNFFNLPIYKRSMERYKYSKEVTT